MSYRTRVGAGFVLVMAVLLLVTGCGPKKAAPTPQAEGPSTSASPTSSDDPASASELTPSGSPSTADNQTHTGSHSSAPPFVVSNVQLKLVVLSEAGALRTKCPYVYSMVVDVRTTGPIDLTYQFVHN